MSSITTDSLLDGLEQQIRALPLIHQGHMELSVSNIRSDLKILMRRLDQLQAAAQPQADPIQALLAKHAELLEENPYCYFELAYTRATHYMAWLCDKPATGTPGEPGYGANRKVLASGQGHTAEEACANALAALERDGGQ